MFFGLAAGILLSFGHHSTVILAAFMYQMANILDCADGQLARLKNIKSRYGRIIDGTADYVSTLSIYVGSAIGLYRNTNKSSFFLVIGLAGIFRMYSAIVYDELKNRYLSFIIKDSVGIEEELSWIETEIKKQAGLQKVFLKLYQYYSRLQNKSLLSLSIKADEMSDILKQMYIEKNKQLIKIWGFFGPSTHAFLFFIFVLSGSLKYYFIFVLTVELFSFLILFGVQKYYETRFKTAAFIEISN